jgi:hypothetical protein
VALARPGRGGQRRRRSGGGEHRDHGLTLLGAEIRACGRRPTRGRPGWPHR